MSEAGSQADSPQGNPVLKVSGVVAGYTPEVDILNGVDLEVYRRRDRHDRRPERRGQVDAHEVDLRPALAA